MKWYLNFMIVAGLVIMFFSMGWQPYLHPVANLMGMASGIILTAWAYSEIKKIDNK